MVLVVLVVSYCDDSSSSSTVMVVVVIVVSYCDGSSSSCSIIL